MRGCIGRIPTSGVNQNQNVQWRKALADRGGGGGGGEGGCDLLTPSHLMPFFFFSKSLLQNYVLQHVTQVPMLSLSNQRICIYQVKVILFHLNKSAEWKFAYDQSIRYLMIYLKQWFFLITFNCRITISLSLFLKKSARERERERVFVKQDEGERLEKLKRRERERNGRAVRGRSRKKDKKEIK